MTYRAGILKRWKHLWACLKRLIPTLNIFHLHLTHPQSLWSVSGQETVAEDLVRHLLPVLLLTAFLSFVLIGDWEMTGNELASAYSRTSCVRKQPFLLAPRSSLRRNDCFRRLWNLHVRLLLVSNHLQETTTYPNWNFPSESLQLQLVNDYIS